MERLVSRRSRRFLSGLFCLFLLTCFAPSAGAEWIDLGGDDFEVRLI